MTIRHAKAVWEGNLKEGKGNLELGSGVFQGAYSFRSRFEEGIGTNPEELIAAALAGCFSMALAHILTEAGYVPQKIVTAAKAHLGAVRNGFAINIIELETEATVSGIETNKFRQYAEEAKTNCPVSKALAGTKIELMAKLKGESHE
ncbi:MAG: OsmC family protein [Kiritimatiellae bacterium]|nr:OsmC family protein [Kiritimatiellia bacterium]